MEYQREPIVIRTGRTVWVRPVRSSDADELQRAFALLSEGSRYRRFLTGTSVLSDQVARYLSDVDHVNHSALVAFPRQRASDIVGVARFVRYPKVPTEADLAITVADRWQGQGLGTSLLALLSTRALAAGIVSFTVEMLADNAAALALTRGAGGMGEVLEGQIITGRISLDQ